MAADSEFRDSLLVVIASLRLVLDRLERVLRDPRFLRQLGEIGTARRRSR